jgi:hypothetical protein
MDDKDAEVRIGTGAGICSAKRLRLEYVGIASGSWMIQRC